MFKIRRREGLKVKANGRLAGSVDVLHCYYAHGEDNEKFQRRSYWLLEEDLSHIVLVHYLEVKGNRDYFRRSQEVDGASFSSQETQGSAQNSEMENSASFGYDQNGYRIPPGKTGTTLDSGQASEFEDVESAYTQQASTTFLPVPEFPQPLLEKTDPALSMPLNQIVYPRRDVQGNLMMLPGDLNLAYRDYCVGGFLYENSKQFEWENVLENCKLGTEFATSFQPSVFSSESDFAGIISTQGNEVVGKTFNDNFPHNETLESHAQIQAQEQNLLSRSIDQIRSSPYEQITHEQLLNSQGQEDDTSSKDTYLVTEQNSKHFSMAKHLMNSSNDDVLKKNDSFNRWMSKELGDVSDSGLTGSAVYWQSVENENQFVDGSISSQYVLGPSLSEDQLFSIIDFSPNWAYAGSETKVLVTGKFLKPLQDILNVKWSCMFGELEVPVDIIENGVLCCLTPQLSAGRVPFCITCSNRVACSEVRDFEYRDKSTEIPEDADEGYDMKSDILKLRLVSLLTTGRQTPCIDYLDEISCLSGKLSSLIHDDDDEWDQIGGTTLKATISAEETKDLRAEKVLKEKLYSWLLDKVSQGGKGPSVLDEYGQGVLHFTAALGYDWAFSPTMEAGVSINFRDIRGWTALHWAAFCGRERTVAYLVSLGAAPGALTDPNPKYPMGRTAADLASSNGHKGIAGYLAESALSDHLSSLKLKDAKEGNTTEVSKMNHAQAATPSYDGGHPSRLSLKDSLAAVCNATQAAARIHQVFRIKSFHRKQIKEFEDKGGISDEDALSMLALKTKKSDHQNVPVQAAATRIQNKFRSWKGRKEFLMIRRQIVKIQAHVRGHQARKNYKSFVWSVGIVEKFLRWRRRGGMRLKPESPSEGNYVQESTAIITMKDNDYDFLKEGRKQSEGRVQKALARVKSMVQYPEARDQYRRMLTVMQEMEEIKGGSQRVSSNSEGAIDMESDLFDLDALLDDASFMP
ncbi:hypothetical protein V2J09_016550 [Rumex salicifolius]